MVFSLQGNIRTNLLVKGLVLDDNVNTKLYLVNVFTLLCDGPTDSGIIEHHRTDLRFSVAFLCIIR